jgi:peptidoglycan/LPS O-acetylase OafA/YrhL
VQYRYVTICTILLSTVVFTLVALGNSMFGLLRLQFVSFLGDISYSTYLLHGIILFYAFRFLIGIKTMQSFTAVQYSFVIFAVVPVVVVLSYLTYRFIEKPLMRYGKNIIKRRAQKQIQL